MTSIQFQDLAGREELFSPGHAACPGCAGPIIIRQVLLAAREEEVRIAGAIATGCMEVVTTIFPHSAWRMPMVHSAFENAASTISGVEAAYRALTRRGRIQEDIRFLAFGGDGGTYDIGLQALSGAMERGHDFTYVCYDNGAYMNTGIQRSSATPQGAFTMTAQAGRQAAGKPQQRKDLTAVAEAHGIPYVAQAAPHRPRDLMGKVRKAIRTRGPSFINVLSPCPRGWRHETRDTLQVSRLAEETCFWPLYEVEEGNLSLSRKPKEKNPVRRWLESQGRFAHLLDGEHDELVNQIQGRMDARWEALLQRDQGAQS